MGSSRRETFYFEENGPRQAALQGSEALAPQPAGVAAAGLVSPSPSAPSEGCAACEVLSRRPAISLARFLMGAVLNAREEVYVHLYDCRWYVQV